MGPRLRGDGCAVECDDSSPWSAASPPATGGKGIRTMGWLTVGMLLTLVIVLTLAGLWLLRSFEAYAKVFSDEHFREVSARLPALKRAALERVLVPEANAVCTPEDPRGMLTSAGLAVLYLVGREGDWFHHYLSVSSPTLGYTAHAVGDMFTCLLVRLLGVGVDRLRLWVSSRTVHHAAFTLSAGEHEHFAGQPVTPLSPEELAAFRRDWILSWRAVRWERI
jgi:hypothetical protein